jgi:hypothetical protein
VDIALSIIFVAEQRQIVFDAVFTSENSGFRKVMFCNLSRLSGSESCQFSS